MPKADSGSEVGARHNGRVLEDLGVANGGEKASIFGSALFEPGRWAPNLLLATL